ncbi:MAG: hypothetical protein FJ118_16915 [Deltaproteobacteria bacterium]|nr:hypothetical protein [Deltaproteobacteria bacterium]
MRVICYVAPVAALLVCVTMFRAQTPGSWSNVSGPAANRNIGSEAQLLAQGQDEKLCCQCCLDSYMSRCSYMDFDKCQAKGGFCVSGLERCAMSVD